MSALYTQRINTEHPGLILILIDQSSSMMHEFGGVQKKVFAADAVNRVIYELRSASQEGQEIKDRCYVGVIGYGSEIDPKLAGRISEFKGKILRVENRKQKLPDGTVIEAPMPIWLEPKAENGTPMDLAFDKAYNVASFFCKERPDSFPPVVINITDGQPNDLQRGDGKQTRMAAHRLMKLSTRDGGLLMFNAHIGDFSKGEILLPNDAKLLHDPYARYLYEISSLIPDTLFKYAEKAGFNPKPGARTMVFNASAEALTKLLNFGSSQFH